MDIWIVLLSQLSRAVEARPDKKPMLSDLRESGNIEQDADVVLFVYRPDFYGIDKMPDDTDSKGKAVCLLAKQRNGRVGEFYLNFIGDKMLFVNPAPVAIVPPAIPAERRYETDDERPF